MKVLVVLLLCLGVALGQRIQVDLTPVYANGFDTVELDDISFVTEIHPFTFIGNFTYFLYGSGGLRTIVPQDGDNTYYVGAAPRANWFFPFIDLHTIQVGNDIWGFGPVNPFSPYSYPQHVANGYGLDIALITTNPRYRYDPFSPLGFEGTFFAVRGLYFGNNIIGYFAGFVADPDAPQVLRFGVLRAFLNLTDVESNNAPRWIHNTTVDFAVIANNSQLISYHAEFKPIMFHIINFNSADPNATLTIVADPATRIVRQVLGSITPGIPLVTTNAVWNTTDIEVFGLISSAAFYYPKNILVLGLGVSGNQTGGIVFIDALALRTLNVVHLPAGASDPKALVIDNPNGTLYVALNGGYFILKIDIVSGTIIGYQRLPFYLTRAWVGADSPNHTFFVSNEQNSKVFRVNKLNYCPTICPEFGWCERGSCVCGPGFQLSGNQCQWSQVIVDRETIKTEKTGEAVLGVFFALALIAAGAGWYLVWKYKRAGYQPV